MMQNMEHQPQEEYVQAGERITPPQSWSLFPWLSLVWKRFFYGAEQGETYFEIERELEEGEKVLWLGRPGIPKMTGGLIAAPILGIVALLLFALIIIGLVLGWGWGMLGILWPAVYAGGFCWGIIAMSRSKRNKLRRTNYMITDQRVVIIIIGKKDRTVEGYYTIDKIQRTERPDGTGNLTFATLSTPSGQQSNTSLAGKLLDIANVRDVEALLRRTFRQKRDEYSA